MPNIRMCKRFCLVRRFAPVAPDGAVVSSLLVVPDSVKQPNPLGEVIACGPGSYTKNVFTPITVKPGDVIVMPKFARGEPVVPWYGQSDKQYAAEYGIKLEDGEELIVLPDSVIAGVIEDYVAPAPASSAAAQ
jgi:hypothetical protein